jgi:hypothetical protein
MIACAKRVDGPAASAAAAEQASDSGDGGACVIPDAADTYDAGDGATPTSGCRVKADGVLGDINGSQRQGCAAQEYGLVCRGPDVDLQAASLACNHPKFDSPPAGLDVYYCCPCQ